MAFRNLTRGVFQIVTNRRFYTAIQQQIFIRKPIINNQQFRQFSSVTIHNDAYKDLSKFLDKEIQLEKTAQKHSSQLPTIQGFEVQSNGPAITLTRKSGKENITVKFNVTHTVNAAESDQAMNFDEAGGQQQQSNSEISQSSSSSQLKSRPTFTVDINNGGQTLSFLCSYLPQDYSVAPEQYQSGENQQQQQQQENDKLEDFQIDEFAIHDGDWNDNVYSADCAVIDGELYDKLLNLLEEHGIGEEFANQLIDFSTAYEHGQYIGLLEKLQQFSKK
ncbi:unnamed protein product [Rotaria sordida]|uniref:Complement component 1 Q subcomponent-binding protein, mitochondrial n=1 Tax=Rotaria sordida TaxID=392033 RepID=A0A819DHZ4_9BILA|nr:unnamed protein product [Rotaria sordida]CAF3838666.1 unnamed protein product [Rotaria sordida]